MSNRGNALPRRRPPPQKRASSNESDVSAQKVDSILNIRNGDPVLDMPLRFDDPLVGDVSNSVVDRSIITAEPSKLHADIYGRKPPHEELGDERLAALKREIGRIPDEHRASLLNALRNNPVLLESSRHTKHLIQSDEFEPKAAAQELARYWRKREEMFGDQAFSDGVFTAPTYNDYLRYYDKCEKAISDADMDDVMKDLARTYIECVNRTKISALDYVLENSPKEEKSALLEAQERGVLLTDETKLQFLRREDFVENKAAARMMSYWKMKKALFGCDIFLKEITLGDIDVERNRFVRLLPGTDDHGRSIMAIFVNELDSNGWTDETIGQYYWYVAHAAMERKSCQQNGLVVLLNYRAGSTELSEKIGPVRQICRTILFDCMPIKFRTSHLFFEPSGWWQWLLVLIATRASGVLQKRNVVHSGTDEENRHEMKRKYGIAPDQFPSDLGGDVDLDSTWNAWLEKRRMEGL